MTKKELLEKLNEEKRERYCDDRHGYYPLGLEFALDLAEQLDEPKQCEIKERSWKGGMHVNDGKQECSLCGSSDIKQWHNYCPNCGAKIIKSEDTK